MKKKKAVEWSAVRAAERVFSLPEAALRCALSVVAMNIVVFTTLFMMNGIWPGIVLGGKGFLWVFSEILFCALGFELLLPYLNHLQKGGYPLMRRMVTAGIALAGCGWIALQYWRNNMDELVQGGMTLAGKYMSVYNLHFHTALKLPEGNPEQVPLVLTAAVCLLIFLLWVLAYLCGRKYVWILMPLSIWLASMFVGVTPEWKSIVWFWVGLFFIDNISEMVGFVGKPLQNPRGRKEYTKGKLVRSTMTLGFMMLVFLLVSLFGQTPSDKIVARAPEFRAFENTLEQRLRSLGNGGINLEIMLGRKKIRSKQTEYPGKVILQLTAEEKPASSLYLKNFQSGKYVGGGWLTDGNDFENACKQDDIDSKALKRLLIGQGYEKQGAASRTTYELVYKHGLRKDALYPYYVDPEDLDMGKLSQDVLIGKPVLNLKKTIHASLSSVPSGISAAGFYDVPNEEKELWNWYSTYVQQHYTAASAEIPTAQELAGKIFRGTITGAPWEINEQRLNLANLVAIALSNYRYNLDMGQVPGDKDLVEYFLSEGGQGFCVHFATAGVEICRYMGIPARYCEGYIAKQLTFKEKDGKYVADVEDKTAHAWVEIYLEYVGWVPVEMTPGYRPFNPGEALQNPLITPPAQEEQSSETLQESESLEESESSMEESFEIEESEESLEAESAEESSEAAFEESSEEESTSNSIADDADDSAVEVGGSIGREEGTEASGDHAHVPEDEMEKNVQLLVVLKTVLLVATVLMLLIAAGVFLYRLICHKIKEYEEKIPRAIKRGRYKTAVLLTNQRLYRRLKREGVLTNGQPNDREYAQALKQRYCAYKESEWDRYMEIVKQTAFSDEPPTAEQADFCFALYHEICNSNKEDEV